MRISNRRNEQGNQLATEGEASSAKSLKTSRKIATRETATTASEEDVFARLVSDEIARTQSSTIQTSFQALVDKQLKIRTRADGSVNMEKVMKGALKWASNAKQNLISSEEADKIYSRTFYAAQLDSNTEALDDSSVTSATADRDLAFEKSRTKLEKLVSGEIDLPMRDIKELATSSIESTQKTTQKIKNLVDESIDKILFSNDNFQI